MVSIFKGISELIGMTTVRPETPGNFNITPPLSTGKRFTVAKTNDGKIEGLQDMVKRFESESAGDGVDEDAKQSIIENAIIFANHKWHQPSAIKFINQDLFTKIQFNISDRGTVSVFPNDDRRTLNNEIKKTFRKANKGDHGGFPFNIGTTKRLNAWKKNCCSK